MQRGPRACGSGQIMSLEERRWSSFLPPGPTRLTQKCLYFYIVHTLKPASTSWARRGEALMCSVSCFVSACNQRPPPCIYCLIWDWRGEGKKNLAGVHPLGQTSEMRKIQGGNTHTHIHTPKHCTTHTNAQVRTSIYFNTHVWEYVARSHGQHCYMQCKHVWGCVLNTHYRGLGELWERLGEKTNKPHRVTGRGGEGGL